MIRYYVILYRKAGISREEFLHAWTVEHVAMVRGLPEVLSVATYPSIDGADFDGVGVLDFMDGASMAACLESPAGRAVRAHTASFADPDRAQRFVVEVDETTRPS